MKEAGQHFPYRCALNQGPREVRRIYIVADTADGNTIVETYRNKVLADRHASKFPTYKVYSYELA